MAKFCGNCGTQLNDNDMFCGKCGTRVESAELAYRQPPFTPGSTNTPTNKIHWLLSFLGQILCAVLFFLPTMNIEALWVSKDASIMDIISEAGYSAIYVILLILFFSAAVVMFLPFVLNKPLISKNLIFMKVMSVLFFVINVIVFILIGNEFEEQGGGLMEYSLNAFGWIYIIVSVIAIVDLMVLSIKTKKN